jgi:thiol-disulfide isomerase/thioredoxin
VSLALRRSLELTIALALAAGLVGGAALWSRSTERGRGEAAFDVARLAPQPAPAVALRDLAGRSVGLEDYRGRVVILNIWATWCQPCREELPVMEALAHELAPRGLTVLAVNHQESEPRVAAFVREYRLTLTVLLDPEGQVATRYRAVGLPATYVVDRTGQLVGSVLGIRNWQDPAARAYLERLLAEPA